MADHMVVALFNLKPGRTVKEYQEFAHDVIRPGMVKMPSVVEFMDYSVSGSLTPTDGGWQLAEIIRINSTEQFEIDNAEMPGLSIAQQWNEWVKDTLVIYLDEL
mgnify:CR=1 FL=1